MNHQGPMTKKTRYERQRGQSEMGVDDVRVGHLITPSGTNSGQATEDRTTSRNHDLPRSLLADRILLSHRDRSDGHSDFVQGPDQVREIPVQAPPTKCRRLQTHFEKPELARWTFFACFQVHQAPGDRHDANPVICLPAIP